MSRETWQQRLAAAIRTRDDIAAEAKAAATSVYGPDTEAWSSEEWTQVIVVALDMLGKEQRDALAAARAERDAAVNKEKAAIWERQEAQAERDAAVAASATARGLLEPIMHMASMFATASAANNILARVRGALDALTPPTPGVPTCGVFCGRWLSEWPENECRNVVYDETERRSRGFCTAACAGKFTRTPGAPVGATAPRKENPHIGMLYLSAEWMRHANAGCEMVLRWGACKLARTPLGGTTGVFITGKHPTCPACEAIVLPDGKCVNGCAPRCKSWCGKGPDARGVHPCSPAGEAMLCRSAPGSSPCWCSDACADAGAPRTPLGGTTPHPFDRKPCGCDVGVAEECNGPGPTDEPCACACACHAPTSPPETVEPRCGSLHLGRGCVLEPGHAGNHSPVPRPADPTPQQCAPWCGTPSGPSMRTPSGKRWCTPACHRLGHPAHPVDREP